MKRFIVHPSSFIVLLLATAIHAQSVRITDKPSGLVHGLLYVPIQATEPVTKVALFINNVKWAEAPGRVATVQVNVGEYIRRLRMRAVGYDAAGNVVGADEMVVNDPRPPFRVRMQAPAKLPESGMVTVSASLSHPDEIRIAGVDFYVGEEKIGTATAPPYSASFDAKMHPNAVYARVVARAITGEEANDVAFFGDTPRDAIDVTLQHIPVSIAAGTNPLRMQDLSLFDDGQPRKIEALQAAGDEPLYVVLLIDYSESMLEELPVVAAAAKQFAQAVLRPQDRIAIVGFNQRTFWLTGFTNDWNAAAQAVDRVKPIGETHLYDSAIEVLYELQKMPGRHALVLLTDGVDQGSAFKLDHLVHYARYAGVPLYPVIKNKRLSQLMRFGVGRLEARRLQAIARDTGATYFIIQKERELPGVYNRIAQELRQQYQLVFYSSAAGSDQWHALRLDTKGGQQLRIPRGYFP
ncbi:MAG TPA: VWA domain-containing protein [Thermoanaerobaculia bacterium]|nr:VWA domain-containing protein [Thermoanaerobaculia bacterium]